MTRNLILMAALTLSVFVGQSQAILVTDTSLENVLGDFVRAGDTDDFYGIVDGVEPFTIGGTTITTRRLHIFIAKAIVVRVTVIGKRTRD